MTKFLPIILLVAGCSSLELSDDPKVEVDGRRYNVEIEGNVAKVTLISFNDGQFFNYKPGIGDQEGAIKAAEQVSGCKVTDHTGWTYYGSFEARLAC